MTLPNAGVVIVDAAKVRDYLLSAEHPIGRFKARFFTRLGHTSHDWPQLQCDIAEVARTGAAQPAQPSAYGPKYEVRGPLHCGGGIGRTGTLATCILLALGVPLEEAKRAVSAAGSAPETSEQRGLVGWCASQAGAERGDDVPLTPAAAGAARRH